MGVTRPGECTIAKQYGWKTKGWMFLTASKLRDCSSSPRNRSYIILIIVQKASHYIISKYQNLMVSSRNHLLQGELHIVLQKLVVQSRIDFDDRTVFLPFPVKYLGFIVNMDQSHMDSCSRL